MVLIISALLALLSLAGALLVVVSGDVATVDGLFLAISLLAFAGIFALTALLHWRGRKALPDRMARAAEPAARAAASRISVAEASGNGNLVRVSGLVEALDFYEAPVGQSNRTLVVLRPKGAPEPAMLIFFGDLRTRLMLQRRFNLTYKPEHGGNVLVSVD